MFPYESLVMFTIYKDSPTQLLYELKYSQKSLGAAYTKEGIASSSLLEAF